MNSFRFLRLPSPGFNASAATALLLLQSSGAGAYCRATTCGDSTADYCAVGQNGCIIDGLPLSWPLGSEVSVGLDEASAKKFGTSQAVDAVTSATESWAQVRCGGEVPQIDLQVAASGGLADIVVEFIDQDWPYENDAVGRTELVFGSETGWLERASIFLNTEGFSLAVNPQGDEVDLVAVLTHELGHVLALDHTPVEGATMTAEAETSWASELRSLEKDDEEGLCALYPAAEDTVVFDLGAGGEVVLPDEGSNTNSGGCSVFPRGPAANGAPWGLLALAAALALGRRRRVALFFRY